MMGKGKGYRQRKDRKTGRKRLAHRIIAEELLGRPLLPEEVVHHRDGDKANNAPDNLVVLSSQRHHASLEYHLRQARKGMAPLFPELLIGQVNEIERGSLFAHVFAQPECRKSQARTLGSAQGDCGGEVLLPDTSHALSSSPAE